MEPAGSAIAKRDATLWYGWLVLAVVFIVMSVMIGLRNSLGFFFKPISEEFGWSRAQTAGAYSLGMLVQGAFSPLFGVIGERWSVRWLMACGVLAGGAALVIGWSIDGLPLFYWMYALLNLGFAASTFVPQVQIISQWFARRRGLAMGIANAGQGFAAVLNLGVPVLIGALGWRGSYLALAGLAILLIFPLAALVLRDRPASRGTVADAPFLSDAEYEATLAVEQRERERGGVRPAADAPWAHRLLGLPFLLVAVVYSAIALIMTSTIVHIVPHATDQGLSPEASALVFLLFGLFMIGGNLLSGFSDRMGRTPTYAVGAAVGLVACVLLAHFRPGMPEWLFHAGAALSGAGLGLTRPTASALLADGFAGPGFGRLNGLVMVVFALFGALGAWATGALFDLSGSYRDAFLLMAAAHAVGAWAATALGRPRRA